MSPLTRRHLLLAGTAGVGSVLAGCNSGPGESTPGEPSQTSSGNAFSAVRTDGMALVVELVDESLDSVSVVAPDGTSFADRTVAAGVTTVEIPLGTDYEPGAFRVLGVVDGETVAETTLDIRPELEIVEVGVGANHLDRMPEDLNFREEQALVTVQNNGSGPDTLTALSILGDVPNPTDRGSTGEEASGLYDPADGYGDAEAIDVPVNQTVTIYSTAYPFLFSDSGFTCSESRQTGSIEIILRSRVTEMAVQGDYEVEYTGSETSDGCVATILGEVA